MQNTPVVRLQHTRVSDVLARTLDDLVGPDIVLKREAVGNLDAAGDLETLGIIGLTRAEPPYRLPYKCTWYQDRYFCRYYRRGSWYLIWDQAGGCSIGILLPPTWWNRDDDWMVAERKIK